MALVCLYELQSLLGVSFVQLLNYFSDSRNNDRPGVNLETYSVEADRSSSQFSILSTERI